MRGAAAPWATAVANAVSAVEAATASPSRPITPKVRRYRVQKLGQRTYGMFQTVFIAFCVAHLRAQLVPDDGEIPERRVDQPLVQSWGTPAPVSPAIRNRCG
jgi:hypothetical protein